MSVNKIVSKYAIDKGLKRSECASLIGVTLTEFYAFFRGNKIIDVEAIRKMSEFSGVPEEEAKKEYMGNLDKYLKEKGL